MNTRTTYVFDSTTGAGEFVDETAVVDPVADVVVPEAISDRQFYQMLALTEKPDGSGTWITQSEALAAVNTGVLPAAIDAFVSSLPNDTQFVARMNLAGSTYLFSHPMTQQLAIATGIDIAAFWRAAYEL